MGIRVAGGSRASGEGAYIIEKDGYYYLFLSYGGLVADGGYNMRVFRSENITGPYIDKRGRNALRTSTNDGGNTLGNVGIRLMAGYKWSCNTNGYLAQGHNSALVDDDGSMYLVYHSRYENSGETHNVFTHQMFMSEDGWLCVAPYEYNGEKISEIGYEKEELVGTYEYLVQNPSQKNGTCATSTYITLGEDGSIGGQDAAGTWTVKAGKPYVTMTIAGVEYQGVFCYGYDESEECNKVMTFSAVGTNNICIWGSKVLSPVKSEVDAQATDAVAVNIAASVTDDFYLPTYGAYGSRITWVSSDENVIVVNGRMAVVNRRLTDTSAALTATITNGTASSTREFLVTVQKYDVNIDLEIDATQITLDKVLGDATVAWTSSNDAVIDPETGAVKTVINDTEVTLTAVLSLEGDENVTKTFDVVVKGIPVNVSLVVKADTIELPTESKGYTITWASSDENVIALDGTVTKHETDVKTITLTATITNGIDTDTREFEVKVLPENYTEYIYQQDYSSVTVAESGWKSTNASEALTIETDASMDKYLQYAPTVDANGKAHNSRGAQVDFAVSENASENYVVEFDLSLLAGNNQTTEFALTSTDMAYKDGNINNGINSGYLFKMSATNSTMWSINGLEAINIPAEWVHVTAVVNVTAGTATVTIENGETTYFDKTLQINGNGALKGMYIRAGRYNSVTKVDNIKVY